MIEGRGQVVSLVGEAGLGKSRLKIELRDNLPDGIRWLEGRCQAHTQSAGYAPFIQILGEVFRLGPAEPPAVTRTKLRVALRSLVGARYAQVHPGLGHLLGVELEAGSGDAQASDPRARQSQLVLAVRAVLEALLARTPVILAVEDLHWADAASVELLTLLSEQTDFLPLMLLVTSRPDAEGGAWEFRFHAQRNYPHRLVELPLNPLDSAHTARLAENLLHVEALPDAVRTRILERSEGNPFFLEELIRTLIERRALRRDGDRWTVLGDLAQLAIPDTLRGVIAARIDRLPEAAKVVLQHAAVVGRFFTSRALRALAEADADLDRALADLLRAELIRERTRLPEREYLFKHALTQEAAYASLLGAERRALHRQLALHLEETLGDAAREQPALLAHHWLRAEEWERALGYTLQAAGRARALYARPEAIAHYWQALDLLDRLPRTPARRRVHADVVLTLVGLPAWTRDDAGREAGLRHLDAAIAAAAEDGDVPTLARLEAVKGYVTDDASLIVRAIARAEASGDPVARAFTALDYGDHLGEHAEYAKSLAHVRQAIDLLGARGAQYDQAVVMAGQGRCYSARAGRLAEALEYAGRAREIASAMDDARLRAWGAMEAEPYMYQGRWDEVVRVAEEGLPVAWRILKWSPILWASGWLAIAYVKLGRLEDARGVLDRALREGRAQAVGSYRLAYGQIALAQLHLALGEPGEALAAAETALALAEANGLRLEEGAAHRVRAEVHEAMGHRQDADAAFRRSLEILGEIQSRPELAQTLLAYGRFRARDDPAEGRGLIQAALRLFEEIEATGWVAEAQAGLSAV